jgi:hypothetical protein
MLEVAGNSLDFVCAGRSVGRSVGRWRCVGWFLFVCSWIGCRAVCNYSKYVLILAHSSNKRSNLKTQVNECENKPSVTPAPSALSAASVSADTLNKFVLVVLSTCAAETGGCRVQLVHDRHWS